MPSQLTKTLSILVLVAGTTAFACGGSSAGANDEEQLLQTGEGLSAESDSSVDPAAEGVQTDADVDAASSEDADENTATPADPTDVGCGIRMSLRQRIKNHFDTNNDGKLDDGERANLRDALGDHARFKMEVLKIGLRVRSDRWRRIEWAYDVNDDGVLDDGERAALHTAVVARCEARQASVLAKFDTNGDGKLDDGEFAEAIRAEIAAKRDHIKDIVGKIDTNGDGKLDDGELAAARAALVADWKARRDALKAKYDTNGDGKIDDGEADALKAAIRARFEKEQPAD